MTVANILRGKGGEIISVGEDQTILEALQVLAQRKIGAVMVKNAKGRIVGVLSERDIVRALPHADGKLRSQKVSSIMTREVITCSLSDSVEAVMEVMTKNRIRHLPVLSGGKPVGVISIGDVVKERISDAEHEAEALKQYITGGRNP